MKPPPSADMTDFDGRTTVLFSGDGHHAPSPQPSLEQEMMRLKDLQRAVFSKQHNDAINSTAPPPGGDGGGHFSFPLIGPGASSPNDFRAPAQRQDCAVGNSSGSDPTSSQFDVYRDPTPPTAAAAVGFPLALPDPHPALPEDFSDDLFCGLEVPSLEDLVQDIGTAESELLSASIARPFTINLNDFNVTNNPRIPVMGGMTRAQTLPAPLPVSEFPNFQSLPLNHVPMEPSTAINNNTTRFQGARGSSSRKRKGGDASQKGSLATGIPEVVPELDAFHHSGLQQQQQQQRQQQPAPPLPYESWNDDPLPSFHHPLQKTPLIELKNDYGMDDDALLDRVASHTSAFAAFATTPLVEGGNEEQHAAAANAGSFPLPSTKSRRTGLSSAASMPNRHWLSPAAAIHAARASKPGDEDVLAWLLHGK